MALISLRVTPLTFRDKTVSPPQSVRLVSGRVFPHLYPSDFTQYIWWRPRIWDHVWEYIVYWCMGVYGMDYTTPFSLSPWWIVNGSPLAVSESSYQELLKQHQENVEQLQLIDKREEARSANKTSLQKQGGFKMIVNVMYIFRFV